jgi:hypothetical protein
MGEGAIREDDYAHETIAEQAGCRPPDNPDSDIHRLLNHFFDVQRGGGGLTVLGFTLGLPAPDWALGRQGQAQNQFSIVNARTYQFLS